MNKTPSTTNLAVRIPEFTLEKSPYLLGVNLGDIEDIERGLSQAVVDIEDYYAHMAILEIYLKEKYEDSDHYDHPWEVIVIDKYAYFVEELLLKVMESQEKDLSPVGISYHDNGTFIMECIYVGQTESEPPRSRGERVLTRKTGGKPGAYRKKSSFGYRKFPPKRRF